MSTVSNSTVLNIVPEDTIATLVIRYPQLRERIEQMGIDYCCGGKNRLSKALQESGLEWSDFIQKLTAALADTSGNSSVKDWTKVPLAELASHILDTHHAYTRAALERIEMLLGRVLRAHGAQHGKMLTALAQRFEAIRDELASHLMKEEQILFPAIIELDNYANNKGPRPEFHCGSVAYPIQQMEHEHDNAGALLLEMRDITDGFTLPPDSCETFAALYEAIPALEADLHEHIHLENNILFPASIVQEQRMGCGCPA